MDNRPDRADMPVAFDDSIKVIRWVAPQARMAERSVSRSLAQEPVIAIS